MNVLSKLGDLQVPAVNLQEVETPWVPKSHQTSRKNMIPF